MYYDILTKIKTELDADPFTNTTTEGDLNSVDLSKQTIFPLTHIIVNNATFRENVIAYNISILAMDIVDYSKAKTTNNRLWTCGSRIIRNTWWHNGCRVRSK